MEQPRILSRDAAGHVGVWRDALFEVWAAPAGADILRARAGVVREHLTGALRPGQKLVFLTLVQERAIRAVERDAREVLDDRVRENAPYTKGAATIIQASGFKAAVIRSISAAMLLLSGVKYPAKTESELEPTLRWAAALLAPEGGQPVPADELIAAFDAFLELATEAEAKEPARERA